MTNADRPLYEDLLKQRNDLEQLVRDVLDAVDKSQLFITVHWENRLDKIIDENRRREGLT